MALYARRFRNCVCTERNRIGGTRKKRGSQKPRAILRWTIHAAQRVLEARVRAECRESCCNPSYRSTSSSIQMLPETSIMGRTSRFAATPNSAYGTLSEDIRPGLSNLVTWNGSPMGLPTVGSKRLPHTFLNPPREETK